MDPVREDVATNLEARLARIESVVGELLELAKARVDRDEQLGRELVEERARSQEAQRKVAELERAQRESERAQARVVALETQLADVSGDLAEREHLAKEFQQALSYERDLRKLREAERDRLRELFGYLQKSRWRRFGQAIGVVKTREWEHAEGDPQ